MTVALEQDGLIVGKNWVGYYDSGGSERKISITGSLSNLKEIAAKTSRRFIFRRFFG
jgi:hypothetical protein